MVTPSRGDHFKSFVSDAIRNDKQSESAPAIVPSHEELHKLRETNFLLRQQVHAQDARMREFRAELAQWRDEEHQHDLATRTRDHAALRVQHEEELSRLRMKYERLLETSQASLFSPDVSRSSRSKSVGDLIPKQPRRHNVFEERKLSPITAAKLAASRKNDELVEEANRAERLEKQLLCVETEATKYKKKVSKLKRMLTEQQQKTVHDSPKPSLKLRPARRVHTEICFFFFGASRRSRRWNNSGLVSVTDSR